MYRTLNFFTFQLGYAACVLGAAGDWPMLGPAVVAAALVVLSFQMSEPARQIGCIATVAVLGTLVESLLASSGMVVFRGENSQRFLCPLWVTALWLNLGMALLGIFAGLRNHLILAVLLGTITLPGHYLLAVWLGAATILWPPLPAVGLLAILGAVLLPILAGMTNFRMTNDE